MFKHCMHCIVPHAFTSDDRLLYVVYDTDFDKPFEVKTPRQIYVPLEMANAVITAYEERKLSIAPNLALALMWISRTRSEQVSDIISALDRSYHVGPDLFATYKDQVFKYLVLV
jgi:hypothetical protein